MKQALDFIIIGAQKSGTTTLFELLKQHSDVYLPPEKELPYFGTKREEHGWNWYMDEYFHKEKIDEKKLWGTITPLYMSSEDFAGKVFSVCPDAKLIAILRNPFDRAYSHYQMMVKRGIETRNFADTAKDLLAPEAFDNARKNPTDTTVYFARSEYGRILKSYLKYYKKENMLILAMHDLENSPKDVLDTICSFLKIPEFIPENLNKKFHEGGAKRKFDFVNDILKNGAIKNFFKNIAGDKAKRKMKRWLFWIDQWNTQKGSDRKDQVNIYIEELMDTFNQDAQLLEKEFGFKAPWVRLFKK